MSTIIDCTSAFNNPADTRSTSLLLNGVHTSCPARLDHKAHDFKLMFCEEHEEYFFDFRGLDHGRIHSEA
jgi:hypothetical protein